MKYLNEKMQTYLEDLRAKKSTPGGGAVAALTGAQGAALVMMVAEFTIGNEKYAAFEEACKGARAANSYVYANLAMLIDQDAEAYNKVVEARKMPESTEAEIVAKKTKMDEATVTATIVPLNVMRMCHEGLAAAEMIIGKCNPNIASDLTIAVLNLLAGLRAAWLNVLINLPGIEDKNTRENFQKQGEMFLRLAAKIEERAKEAGLFPDFNPPDEDDEVQKILQDAGWA